MRPFRLYLRTWTGRIENTEGPLWYERGERASTRCARLEHVHCTVLASKTQGDNAGLFFERKLEAGSSATVLKHAVTLCFEVTRKGHFVEGEKALPTGSASQTPCSSLCHWRPQPGHTRSTRLRVVDRVLKKDLEKQPGHTHLSRLKVVDRVLKKRPRKTVRNKGMSLHKFDAKSVIIFSVP